MFPRRGVPAGEALRSTPESAGMEAFLEMEFREAREAFERRFLLTRLAAHNNNITHTAEAIGIHRQSLQQKIKDLDLKKYLT